MERVKGKRASLSALRLAATAGVILLHLCSTLTDNPALFGLSDGERALCTVLIKSMTWCAPCFLMITGALVLAGERTLSVRDCVFKYARRPFLALIVFGLPFALAMEYAAAGRLSLAMLPAAALRVLSNRGFAHMWYVYMLLGIYLVLPLVKGFTERCTDGALVYLLAVLYIFNFALPLASKLLGVEIAFQLPTPSCFLFYLLMGHYLTRARPAWAARVGLALAGIAAHWAAVIALCAAGRPELDFVAIYESPLTAVYAICVFNLFARLRGEASERTWALDRLCFGVYLIHPLIIHVLFRLLGITPTGSLMPLKLAGIWVGVTAAAFLASWLLRQIPPLKKYVL